MLGRRRDFEIITHTKDMWSLFFLIKIFMKKTAIRLGLLIFILEGRKMNAVYAGRLGGTCRDF